MRSTGRIRARRPRHGVGTQTSTASHRCAAWGVPWVAGPGPRSFSCLASASSSVRALSGPAQLWLRPSWPAVTLPSRGRPGAIFEPCRGASSGTGWRGGHKTCGPGRPWVGHPALPPARWGTMGAGPLAYDGPGRSHREGAAPHRRHQPGQGAARAQRAPGPHAAP